MPTKSLQATIFGVDKASNVFNSVGKSADEMAGDVEKSGSRMGSAFSNGAKLAAGALAAVGFTEFVKGTITEASNLEQNIGAVESVFKSTSGTITAFGENSSETVGIAKQDYFQLATVFGAQLKNMGVAVDEIAPKTNELVQLGADLSSMYGGTAAEAVEAISSLLRGERDPIERYGVSIKQASINAYELANGLDTSTAEAKTASDTQASLALLFQQTSDAQGNFARESDTLAGAQQRATAKFKEAQAEIGTKLLPIITDLTTFASQDLVPILGSVADVLGGMIDVVDGIPGPVKIALAALLGFKLFQQTAVFEKLAVGVRGFRDEMLLQQGLAKMEGVELSGMGAAAAVARPKVSALGKTLAKGGALAAGIWVVSSISDAFSKLSENSDRAADSARTLADALVESGGAWDEAAGKQRQAQIEGMTAFDTLIKSGVSYSDIMRGMTGDTDAFNALLGKIGETGGGDLLFGVIDELTKMHGAMTTGAADLAKQKIAYNEMASAADSAAQSAAATASNYAGQARAEWESLGGAQDDARTSAVGAKADYELLGASLSTSAQMQDESRSSAVDLAKAWRDTGEASKMAVNPIGAMKDAIAEFDSTTSDADTRLKFFTLSIDELSGRNVSLEDATKLLNDQVRDIEQAFKDATEATKGNVESLIDNSGAIDTATQAGSDLYDKVNDFRRAYDTATTAAYNNAIANGQTVPEAMKAGRDAADDARAAFLEQATQLGINATDAKKLADHFGILNGIKIEDKVFGVTATDTQAKAAVTYYDSWQPKDKSFTITAIENLVQAKGPDGSIFHGRYAEGGWIVGPGGPKSDRVAILASPNEFVVNAEAASKYGPLLEMINAGGSVKALDDKPVAGGLVMSDGGALVDEVRALRADVSMMGQALQASSVQGSRALVGAMVSGTAALRDDVRGSAAQNARLVVGAIRDLPREQLRIERTRGR